MTHVNGIFLLCVLLLSIYRPAMSQTPQPSRLNVNGVELHYIEAGRGVPVILLHGGTGDYRSLALQWETLARDYHVISYSRRYHYPNQNAITLKNHSAIVEAEDLAAFIRKLKLGRVHLIGASYGAFTALTLALKHPEMVRSLLLAEPPVHGWMKGTDAYRDFMTNIWEPSGLAFKSGEQRQAMRIFVDGLFGAGYFDSLPTATSAAIMQNARAMEAVTLSSNPFPYLPKEKVRQLRIPTLILTGANTIKIHRLVDEELARLIPNASHVVIANSSHSIARDKPEAFNTTMLNFLAKQE
jgi:non-heme chloroperoxidase